MYWGPRRHHRRAGQLELMELWTVEGGWGLTCLRLPYLLEVQKWIALVSAKGR